MKPLFAWNGISFLYPDDKQVPACIVSVTIEEDPPTKPIELSYTMLGLLISRGKGLPVREEKPDDVIWAHIDYDEDLVVMDGNNEVELLTAMNWVGEGLVDVVLEFARKVLQEHDEATAKMVDEGGHEA